MGTSKRTGPGEIQAAIARLAEAISERHRETSNLLLLGIANGGVELARRLGSRLNGVASARVGVVDISFHRDDIGRHPIPKEYAPTHIPGEVDGATIVLVDDVLFSGRTLKAALDEVFDHGRPAKVELAVLVDRGGRRLPFAADYVGLSLPADANEKVVVQLEPERPQRDSIRIETLGGASSRPTSL